MPLTVEQFTERLIESGILPDAHVREFVAALPAQSAAHSNAEELARELVRQKKLTKFQAEQIYLGKGASLILGNYVILDKLGQGGMGMVLKAEHKRMKRQVAIKVMSPAAVKTPDALKRFHREVEAAAKLRHPNIVAADDADEAKGTHFLVMEYVEGSDLSVLVKKNGPFTVDKAVRCIIQAARGLEYAHEQGIVHRDIKPANLLLDAKGTVKILDMGLARIDDSVGGSSEGAGLTSTGTIMGTVDYMSPEQAMDTKQADARSDIYSLGCSLYYLLTGRSLFDGDTIMKKLIGHREGAIPDLESSPVAPRQESRTSLAAGSSSASSGVDGASAFVSRSDTATLKTLNSVFKRMVAKKPQERQQSMTEVIADLERCLSGGSTTSANERSSSSATNVSVSSTGGTTNDLKDFLRQIAGSESPTVSAVQGSGTAVSASSVDAPTMISTSSDALTNPGTDKTQLFDQASHPIATKARAVPSQSSNSRMKLLIGSVATIAIVLLAVIFAMKGEPKKDRQQEIASTTNRETRVAAAPANTPTPYEILTSDEYEWTPPENLGPEVNTNTSDTWPALSGDGLRLVFFSHGRADRGLCEATRPRIDQPFGPAKSLGEDFGNNSVHAGVTLSADGLVLVFASGRPGGPGEPGNMNLWQATRPDLATPFSKPICLGTINQEGQDQDPWLSSDGLTIYFHSHRSGQGTYWTSRRASRDGDFAPPTPFELPLLPGTDGYSHADGFGLSSDERVLLFAPFYRLEGRDRMNLLKFVRSTRDAKFDTPVNLDPELNGEHINGRPTLSADGAVLVFQSERPGGIGGQDLWTSRRVRKSKVNAPPNSTPSPAVAPFDAAQARAHQEAWAKHLAVPVEFTNSIGMKFRLIPPGEFTMGMTKEEVEAVAATNPYDQYWKTMALCSAPAHKVRLTQAYYLGTYEVTQEQYEKVTGVNPSYFSAKGEGKELVKDEDPRQHPVEQVSFIDAAEFCIKLSKQEQLKPVYFSANNVITPLPGDGYRLPTEAEWEWACRAGTNTSWFHGEQESTLGTVAWFGVNSGGRTHAVGQLKANPFGLYDVNGNVWEWCQDWHDAQVYAQRGHGPTEDPQGPDAGSTRVLRGGSWHYSSAGCRSAFRGSSNADSRLESYGFRVSVGVEAVRQAVKSTGAAMPKAGASDSKTIPAGGQSWPADAPKPAIAPFDAAQARAHQEAWARHLGTTVESTNSVGVKMVLIPPGEFLMGSNDEQIKLAGKIADETQEPSLKSRIAEERPQHHVRITKPFRLGAHEVTVGQFAKFIDHSKYKTQAEEFGGNSEVVRPEQVKPDNLKLTWRSPGHAVTDDSPVTQVNWNDAVAFCNWLSEQESLPPCYQREGDSWSLVTSANGYRLPTEAEWEYCCRAGTTTQFSFGDDWKGMDPFGWSKNNASGGPQSVGLRSANPFGLFDMHGNVWEWCHDGYDAKWYEKSPPNDPTGPPGSLRRVDRGGSWGGVPAFARSAFRISSNLIYRYDDRGFRIVQVLTTPATTTTSRPWTDWLGPKLAQGAFLAEHRVRQGWQVEANALTTKSEVIGEAVLPGTTRDGAVRLTYLLRDAKGVQINARDHKVGERRELYVAEDHGTKISISRVQAGSPNDVLATGNIPESITKDAARTLEFRIVGDTLTATLNDSVIATAKDATITEGNFALVALRGVLIQKVEYQSLDKPK